MRNDYHTTVKTIIINDMGVNFYQPLWDCQSFIIIFMHIYKLMVKNDFEEMLLMYEL